MDTAELATSRTEDPLAPTIESMEAEIERGIADAAAGRTVDAREALRRFHALANRLRHEAAGAAHRQS